MTATERVVAGAAALLFLTGVATASANARHRDRPPAAVLATAEPIAPAPPAPVVHVVDNGDIAAARATIDELRARLAERAAAAEKPPRSTLVVTGTGRVPSVPDVLRLSVGVSVARPTVKEALAGARDAATRVIDALKANGVAAKDIQTTHLNVHEHWANGARNGYAASHAVTAKLRDSGRMGAVTAAAAEAGGEDARIHGVMFDLEENEGPMAQARKAAMADARRKAEDVARLAGRKLGPVLAVDDGSNPSGGAWAGRTVASSSAGASLASGSVPVEPGTLDTVFRLTVTYALD